MAARPPSDAVAALRSLGRRYRGLFAGLSEDESPDDLAFRPGADGWSARDHAVAATKAIAAATRELGPVLGPPRAGAPAGPEVGGGTTIGDVLDELAAWADALADRAEHVTAESWAESSALPTLWDAVDTAVTHLRDAERTMAEVRGRP